MDNKIKLELTIEEMHSIMTAVENYRIHLINTAIKNGEDHRFDGTIKRLGALDASLYGKLTDFLNDAAAADEKEEAPLTAAQKVEFLSDSITKAEKARVEAEKQIKNYAHTANKKPIYSQLRVSRYGVKINGGNYPFKDSILYVGRLVDIYQDGSVVCDGDPIGRIHL